MVYLQKLSLSETIFSQAKPEALRFLGAAASGTSSQSQSTVLQGHEFGLTIDVESVNHAAEDKTSSESP